MIETERLLLRPPALADLDERAAIVGDPEVTRLLGGPQSGEENWARILRYAGHWHLLGYGLFTVIEKESGRMAGEIGLADFHRGLGDAFDPFPEGAWILAGWAAGKGYATEAMQAAIAWFEGARGPQRMVCVIGKENAPSLRVAARLGFSAFAETTYKDRACHLLAREPTPLAG